MTKSIYRNPNRYPISRIEIHIDISLMSDLPYRSPISISDHILTPCVKGMIRGKGAAGGSIVLCSSAVASHGWGTTDAIGGECRALWNRREGSATSTQSFTSTQFWQNYSYEPQRQTVVTTC